MAGLRSAFFISLLCVLLMVTAKAKASGCDEAQDSIIECSGDYDVEFSRVTDASYKSTFCSKTQDLIDCMEDVLEDCPRLRRLVAGSMSQLTTSANNLCSDPENCNSARSSLVSCVTDFDADYSRLSDPSYLTEFCSESRELITCVHEQFERCPQLRAEVGQSMDHMVSAVQSACQK